MKKRCNEIKDVVNKEYINAALYSAVAVRRTGMPNAAKGFTLIELLVVVLIIGILAAVALPQYQKAVEKSRSAQAFTLLRAVYQAAIVYQLENGSWPKSFEDIDVSPAWTGNTVYNNNATDALSNDTWSVNLVTNNVSVFGVEIGRIFGPYTGTGFAIYQSHPYAIPKGKILCLERHLNGIAYEGEPGSYCTKIWRGNGVYVGERHWADIYDLP